MLAHEYQTLFDLEESYWWFRGLRGVLLDVCRSLKIDRTARILDAGCGTGHTVGFLRAEVSPRTHGFDVSRVAATFWVRKRLPGLCVGSINEVPYRSGCFDAVVAVDVLESDGVLEKQAVSELWRVLRVGGSLILVVPAYGWMLSPEHHEAVGASHRYNRRSVLELLDDMHVRIVRSTHLFATFFIPIAAYRLWQRLVAAARTRETPPGSQDRQPRSELRKLSPRVNSVLAGIMNCERAVLGMVDLPFGSSILIVAEKRLP
jgi:SAM-dependent methyltransferase